MSHFLADEYLALWETYGVEVAPGLRERLLAVPVAVPAQPVPVAVPPARPAIKVLFLGDADGTSGEARQLLDKIVAAMGLARADAELLDVALHSQAALRAEIEARRPRCIVALGEGPAQALLGETAPIARLRGTLRPLSQCPNIVVMATYSPAHLLRVPEAKKAVWDDMKQVMARLEAPR